MDDAHVYSALCLKKPFEVPLSAAFEEFLTVKMGPVGDAELSWVPRGKVATADSLSLQFPQCVGSHKIAVVSTGRARPVHPVPTKDG